MRKDIVLASLRRNSVRFLIATIPLLAVAFVVRGLQLENPQRFTFDVMFIAAKILVFSIYIIGVIIFFLMPDRYRSRTQYVLVFLCTLLIVALVLM